MVGFWEQTEDREPPQMIAGHEQLGDTPVAQIKWAKSWGLMAFEEHGWLKAPMN